VTPKSTARRAQIVKVQRSRERERERGREEPRGGRFRADLGQAEQSRFLKRASPRRGRRLWQRHRQAKAASKQQSSAVTDGLGPLRHIIRFFEPATDQARGCSPEIDFMYEIIHSRKKYFILVHGRRAVFFKRTTIIPFRGCV